jgi:RNA polymerase sigma factor (sigma-70 family)
MNMEELKSNQNNKQEKKNQMNEIKKAKITKNANKFKKLINKMLPALRTYIARRLNMAHSTGLINKYGISPEEVIDVVYLTLYDRVEQEQKHAADLETWVYQVVDEVLDAQLMEKIFESEHLIYLQKMEDLELSGLEEKYSVDAEGELIMDEELDDVSYQQKLYNPADFLQDTDTLESIENQLSEYDKIKMHDEIQRYLIPLAEEERTIFDLFWIVGLSMKQIARIKKISVPQVENILKRVGAHIRKKLSNRPGGWKLH